MRIGADGCRQDSLGLCSYFGSSQGARERRRIAMVRKGSTVRVRQRASETVLQRGFLCFGAARVTTSERFRARRGQPWPLHARCAAGLRLVGASRHWVEGTHAVHARPESLFLAARLHSCSVTAQRTGAAGTSVTRWLLIAVVTGDLLAILSTPKRASSDNRSNPPRHCHCGRPRRKDVEPPRRCRPATAR
jgi:hypothetical protein